MEMNLNDEQGNIAKKRVYPCTGFDGPESKKPRLTDSGAHARADGDMISCLSDEILIRILKFLPVTTVLLCRILSKRWLELSTDIEVWQSLYWNQFVRPHVRKKNWKNAAHNKTDYCTKQHGTVRPSNFDPYESHSQQDTSPWIDWMARFRLRHNWSRGSADVTEIGLDEGGPGTTCHAELEDKLPDMGSLMVQIIDGKVLTVDHVNGLRVWDLQKNGASSKCIAQVALANDGQLVPTALALDKMSESDIVNIVVGFQDGGFGIWQFNIRFVARDKVFSKVLSRSGSGEEGASVIAAAYSHPHLLTITEEQALSLYVFEGKAALLDEPPPGIITTRLLSSLKSHTTWPPLSLSIRSTPQAIIASIAYSLPTYSSGWSVGLQELHISHNGAISLSRLASAMEPGFHPLSSQLPPVTRNSTSTNSLSPGIGAYAWLPTNPRPSCLSYSHPYLLASHSNNTLTLYLVTSTQDDLKIGMGKTLWGHTSSVSGAHVGGRGKAVSVSSGGKELRVWELERGLLSRKVVNGESVRVRAEGHDTGIGSGSVRAKGKGDWIGFDDEVVIVLKESEDGSKALVVYDFT